MHLSGSFDRHLERRTHSGIEIVERLDEGGCGNADTIGPYAVELLAEFEGSVHSPIAHRVDHRTYLMQHRIDIHSTSRESAA